MRFRQQNTAPDNRCGFFVNQSLAETNNIFPNLLKMKSYSFSYSVDASSNYNKSLSYTEKGYTPIGVISYNCGTYGLDIATLTPTYVSLSNPTANKLSAIFSIAILFIKNF